MNWMWKGKSKGKLREKNAISIDKNQISSNCHDEIISQNEKQYQLNTRIKFYFFKEGKKSYRHLTLSLMPSQVSEIFNPSREKYIRTTKKMNETRF